MKILIATLAMGLSLVAQIKPIPKPKTDPAKCLVIDSLVIQPAACSSGSCETGPGVVVGADLTRALVGSFEVIGHNSCSSKQPVGHGVANIGDTWIVSLAFYDKDDYRISIAPIYVGSLKAGEKFKHLYALPDDGRTAVLAKVREISVF